MIKIGDFIVAIAECITHIRLDEKRPALVIGKEYKVIDVDYDKNKIAIDSEVVYYHIFDSEEIKENFGIDILKPKQ